MAESENPVPTTEASDRAFLRRGVAFVFDDVSLFDAADAVEVL